MAVCKTCNGDQVICRLCGFREVYCRCEEVDFMDCPCRKVRMCVARQKMALDQAYARHCDGRGSWKEVGEAASKLQDLLTQADPY